VLLGQEKPKIPPKKYTAVYVFLFSKKEMICCWDVSGAAQCIFLTTASSQQPAKKSATAEGNLLCGAAVIA
jgi:hypothetical protein